MTYNLFINDSSNELSTVSKTIAKLNAHVTIYEGFIIFSKGQMKVLIHQDTNEILLNGTSQGFAKNKQIAKELALEILAEVTA